MLKDLVVNLSLGSRHDIAAEFAVSVAAEFGAHVAAVAFVIDRSMPALLTDEMLDDVVQAQQPLQEAARIAVDRFTVCATAASVAFNAHVIPATSGDVAYRFGRIARRFDLSIIKQAETDGDALDGLIIEDALFSSGRPLLIVPYIQTAGLKLDRILLCWDGSRNAARAAADALPFFARAKSVEVVMIDSDRIESEESPGADIEQHLVRHGIPVKARHIVEPNVDTANVMLSYAADIGADLLVMGGYGHSRLRELVLGGATRDILKTMTVPTLMSH